VIAAVANVEEGGLKHPLVVGVIHLPALPGTVTGQGARAFGDVLEHAKREAAAWTAAGADALIVENFSDVPFHRDRVGPETVAAMTLAADVLRRESELPLGLNVLRNDVESAVAIAAMVGGSFVRANVYAATSVTDQGVIEGDPLAVQRLIRRLDAPVAVWADVDVKHAAPLAPRPLADLAEDAVIRGLASALIVSGRATGQPASPDDLATVRHALRATPLYVGSGATVAQMPTLLRWADGVIVGSAAKVDGIVTNPVDPDRAAELVRAATRAREEIGAPAP
jgi:membrane complex biogenesis BtpA family protein